MAFVGLFGRIACAENEVMPTVKAHGYAIFQRGTVVYDAKQIGNRSDMISIGDGVQRHG